MRKPTPVVRWCVVVRGKRSRWLHTHTLAYTRRECIANYVELFREELRPVIWRRMRRKGYTCERVTVSVARG